jgi:pilus assembly protein CpaE
MTQMANELRVCLFDAGTETTPGFREPFEQLRGLTVVGSTDQWEQLREWVRGDHVDVAIFNLDDEQRDGQAAVEQLAQFAPSCSIVGVSAQTDPAFIIAAMRAGCSQFVPWPIDQSDLANALARVKSSQRTSVHSSQRICVVGSSGGVGATTIACNLAMEFGELAGQQVSLVDLNLEFGDVGCSFDCQSQYSIADVCREDVEIDEGMLTDAMHELPCNIALMPRPESIEQAREVAPEGVQRMLEVMGEIYPFVVVDLPRSFSFFSAAAVGHADRVIVVAQLSVASIRNATRIMRLMHQMGTPDERIHVVLNRYKASYERISLEEVEQHFKRPIFAMIPNDYRRIQSALDLGQPVMTDAPNSPARLAIQEMAQKIAGGEETMDRPVATQSSGGGIFGKFWKRSNAGT